MDKIVLIDGNSILNRAFYGIMGSKMLMTEEGTYTNAVYGFLSIMFKIIDDLNPKYLVVAFDLKAPTKRHKMYEGYKATRKGMPEELATQMPIIKEVLKAMNIDIIEMEGYEADDVLGTLSIIGEQNGLEVTILSGDRDTFQLATDKVTIRIPRTKAGKTEVDDFDKTKVLETYGLEPKQLIDVKGLQGDASDNIPGVPGVGEKTALKLIIDYGSIENLYEKLEKNETDLKGKLKENLENNKELAALSKELGTIDLAVPITDKLEDMIIEQWDYEKVYNIFRKLRFNKYIEKFNLRKYNENIEDIGQEYINQNDKNLFEIEEIKDMNLLFDLIRKQQSLIYYLGTTQDSKEQKIINKRINGIYVYSKTDNKIYVKTLREEEEIKEWITIFEDEKIQKFGYNLGQDYILLKQQGITIKNIYYDAKIAAYLLNPTKTKYQIEDLALDYLGFDVKTYIENLGIKNRETQTQMNLFDLENEQEKTDENEYEKNQNSIYVFCTAKIYDKTMPEIEKRNEKDLFYNIEMPLIEVLADMQYNGIYVDKNELVEYGNELKDKINKLIEEIYQLAEVEFNINSTKQLGEILFDRLGLPGYKKTKSGYSTDVDVLEKLKDKHPIIEKLLDYRQLTKLNSTYVEGLIPYINKKDHRIHSFFHQTVTATGRISSTDPNLQNIPTRIELGKRLRKVFKPRKGSVYIDADYSQIELRVLAHIANDEKMIQAFKSNEDIHTQAAAMVFNLKPEEVTKEERSKAKAVNFGIVYGISDFGLSEQLGVGRKVAKEYIEQYLDKYNGIKEFMNEIVETAKQKGYIETLFHRRRDVPEINSKNYNIRQFGQRIAMNTPIQGTAADIMKIAMINVYKELEKRKLESKLILQVHDELLIESPEHEKEEVKKLLKECMEDATKLNVPLIADLSEANNWYEVK